MTIAYLLLWLLLLDIWACPILACFPRHRFNSQSRRRPQRPLVLHERAPSNTPEFHPRAAGPPRGKIHFKDSKFKELVRSFNPDVEFLDEESTGEDRLMTRRTREKLDNLAVLVLHSFPGRDVGVRVTEAYDLDGTHSRDSLHYEGRALDITTTDLDYRKYGVLARLAVRAGFDYVFYEAKTHVHVSVKPDDAPRTRLRGCFPSDSTVLTHTGPRRMDALRIGDEILSVNRRTGELTYSPIVMFGHHDNNVTEQFIRVTTTNNVILHLSPFHIIFRWQQLANQEIGLNTQPYRAESIFSAALNLGDLVAVSNGTSLHFVEISDLQTVVKTGVHAPITAEGTVVVDDVVASSYAGMEAETIAHWALLPVRVLHWMGFSAPTTSGVNAYLRTLVYFAETFLRWEL